MEKVVDDVGITAALDEYGTRLVNIDSSKGHLQYSLKKNGEAGVFITGDGYLGCLTIGILKTALEMLSDDDGKMDCTSCKHEAPRDQPTIFGGPLPRPYCRLARCFTSEMGACILTMPVEEIRKHCVCYIPPEEMADGEGCCTAHMHEGRVPACSLNKVGDLCWCEDYELKKLK